MKTERDFRRKSIRIGLMSAINFGIIGVGGIWISREIGPVSRGELTKMLLVYVVIGIISETGLLGAATYFASRNVNDCKIILRLVRKKILINSLTMFPFFIPILIYFQVLSMTQIILSISTLFISNLFSGPSHILQAIDIDLWRKVQYTQAFSYMIFFIPSFSVDISTNFAFMLIVLPGLVSGIAAQYVLRRFMLREGGQLSHESNSFSYEFHKYSKRGFLWIVTNEFLSRLELLVASIYLSNSDLGNFSLLLSWLMISNPFSGAIGNIVFPEIARNFTSNRFMLRQVYVYMRNAIFTSILLTSILALLVPFVLDRIMQGVYFDYSVYLIPMAILVLVKQTSSVLAEIIRGLDLNVYYSLHLSLIFIGISIFCLALQPHNPFSILVIVISGHIVNIGAGYYMVSRSIQKKRTL